MAQPQHTRNDPHAGCMTCTGPNPRGPQLVRALRGEPHAEAPIWGEKVVPPEIVFGGYDPPPLRPYRDFFTDSGNHGPSGFQQSKLRLGRNESRGGSQPCGGLVEPPCEGTAYKQVSVPFSTTHPEGYRIGPSDALHQRRRRRTTGQSDPRRTAQQPFGVGRAPSGHRPLQEVQPEPVQLRRHGRHPAASRGRVCRRVPECILSWIRGRYVRGRELEDRGLGRNDDRGLQATLRTIGRDAGRTGSVDGTPDRPRCTEPAAVDTPAARGMRCRVRRASSSSAASSGSSRGRWSDLRRRVLPHLRLHRAMSGGRCTRVCIDRLDPRTSYTATRRPIPLVMRRTVFP